MLVHSHLKLLDVKNVDSVNSYWYSVQYHKYATVWELDK